MIIEELGILSVMGVGRSAFCVNAAVFDTETMECKHSVFSFVPLLGAASNPDAVVEEMDNILSVALGYTPAEVQSGEEGERQVVMVDGRGDQPTPLAHTAQMAGGLAFYYQTAFPAGRYELVNDALRNIKTNKQQEVKRLANANLKREMDKRSKEGGSLPAGYKGG